jgi:glycosyltransferase involved in cell wall biosynthesis
MRRTFPARVDHEKNSMLQRQETHEASTAQYYARTCQGPEIWRYEYYALQHRSVAVRDVFAYAISANRYGWPELQELVRSAAAGRKPAAAAFERLRDRPLRALARILVNQRLTETDTDDGLAIYGLLAQRGRRLSNNDKYLYLEAAADSKRDGCYRSALRTTALGDTDFFHVCCLTANVLGLPDSAGWLSTINTGFASANLAPIGIARGPGSLFERIEAKIPQQRLSGPLVSVVMPTRDGWRRIGFALTSLLSQTWANLEIIVVDDGSDSEAREQLANVVGADSRVSLLYHAESRGAYAARNTGLRAATGKYVICHDDDDWSHPEKLAAQVELLEQNPTLVASMSNHVRATEDLFFRRINVNPRLVQPNYSSLMFRRNDVLRRCGGWDEVSRGSDAEFKARLETAFATEIPIVSRAPLSFSRERAGSLTSGELVRGYVDPRRIMYRKAYERWHRGEARDWRVQAAEDFGFHRPLGIAGDDEVTLETVYVADFRASTWSAGTLGDWFRGHALPERVGLLQLDSLMCPVQALQREEFWKLLERGAKSVTLNDRITASRIVVLEPNVFQYADGMESRVSGDCIDVLTPAEGDRGHASWDTTTVLAQCRRLFSGDVRLKFV